LKINCKSV